MTQLTSEKPHVSQRVVAFNQKIVAEEMSSEIVDLIYFGQYS